MNTSPILLTWIAVNNDPYERDRGGEARVVDGVRTPGPTLTLLFDKDSLYADKINEVILLHRSLKEARKEEQRAVRELEEELNGRSVRTHHIFWDGEDPTDHHRLFNFLRGKLPELRHRFRNRELVIHISPGTASMQTVWVLMAETGFIEQPFAVVKSYRRRDRYGRPAVVPVKLGIETFYKAYRESVPSQVAAEDQRVLWDPARFQTDAMRRVYAEARRYAQINVPVLIRGERGTGKTTLASWIRSNSPFKRGEQDKNWPSVACGQYSPETMRAELFGYKRGAFTGATSDREGLLAAADKDTLFLDEIGDVSRDLQRLLIKAIEEKTYFALGDNKASESNFRLLTATNVSDAELRLRLDPDFLDRISLLTLELPPLRDIAGELHWLWEAVYEKARVRAGVSKQRAFLEASDHKCVVTCLRNHSLPGNLRDLFRVAYRILAACNDVDDPMPSKESVKYGLVALKGASRGASESISKEVAAAFANGNSINGLIQSERMIVTNDVLTDFRAFIARELRLLASAQGTSVDELCDVSERTIRKWANARKDLS